MSCTVFKSTNTVDQSINVFPIPNMLSQLRILRNYDSATGSTYNFFYEQPSVFKCVGGKLSIDGGLTFFTELTITGATNVQFILDENREYGYLAWDKVNALQGTNIGAGAYPDYSLGLHCESPELYRICADSPFFNQRVDQWDVKNTTDFAFAFVECANFNRSISHLNTENALTFKGMFLGCLKFNQPIDTLKSSKVTDFSFFLSNAISFNQPINIDTSSGLYFGFFLQGTKNFNQDLSGLNTSNALDMNRMFANSVFNSKPPQNTSKVKSFEAMFAGNRVFNQPLVIDVQSSENFLWMFRDTSAFNQDISEWNIRKCLNFTEMFFGATSFNQDLSKWCNKFNMNAVFGDMFNNSGLSTENYDKFLNALWLDVGTTRQSEWANRSLSKFLYLEGKKYSQAGAQARSNLIGAGWSITDGGQA